MKSNGPDVKLGAGTWASIAFLFAMVAAIPILAMALSR